MAVVSAFTIIILANLDVIDRWTWYVLANCHKFLRKKMESKPDIPAAAPLDDLETGGLAPPDPFLVANRRPGFWGIKAGDLALMDNRKEIMGEGVSSQMNTETSSWWYWLFLIFYGIVKLPMTEIAFAVRATWRTIPSVGPLQKIVRLPWVPLWLLILSLVYAALMVGYGLAMVWGLACKGVNIAWHGSDYTKEGAKGQEEEKKAKGTDQNEEPAVVVEVEEAQVEASWWRKPLHAMEYEVVLAAYHSRKKERTSKVTSKAANTDTDAVTSSSPTAAETTFVVSPTPTDETKTTATTEKPVEAKTA